MQSRLVQREAASPRCEWPGRIILPDRLPESHRRLVHDPEESRRHLQVAGLVPTNETCVRFLQLFHASSAARTLAAADSGVNGGRMMVIEVFLLFAVIPGPFLDSELGYPVHTDDYCGLLHEAIRSERSAEFAWRVFQNL